MSCLSMLLSSVTCMPFSWRKSEQPILAFFCWFIGIRAVLGAPLAQLLEGKLSFHQFDISRLTFDSISDTSAVHFLAMDLASYQMVT
jgi:hypothetical protein